MTSPQASVRRATPGDLDALLVLFSRHEVNEFLFDGKAPDRAAVAEWIAISDASFAAYGLGLWLAEADGELLGCVAIEPREGRFDLIYALEPSRWGQGLATGLAAWAIDQAFARTVARLTADVDGANAASRRVLERLGFRLAGTLELPLGPGARYELVADCWKRPGTPVFTFA